MQRLLLRFKDFKPKALTLSYDDGVEQDIKLIEIMNKYGLKGTFNINSGLFKEEGYEYPKGQIHRRMTKKECYDLYKNSGHEVAVHALTHPHLEDFPSNVIIDEVISDRRNLEQMFGTIIRGMAYPYGTYNDLVVDALKVCNIAYSRAVRSTEKFDIPKDWLRLSATCHHKNPNLMSLAKKFVEDEVKTTPYLFYLWGHSYEFEADNNWNVIEEFAQYISNKNDVWYATNIEIYDYIKAFESLILSNDAKIIKNPSDLDIYFVKDNKEYVIKSGETIFVN
ncbi:MAG: polysaccharide deacetylase [Ruminococcaceae bacterium]|nr:polysaccharide deacetylase [Oscillospiraceae bacterium]